METARKQHLRLWVLAEPTLSQTLTVRANLGFSRIGLSDVNTDLDQNLTLPSCKFPEQTGPIPYRQDSLTFLNQRSVLAWTSVLL